MSDISGLSSVTGAGTAIPAGVRTAGKDAEQLYRVALGFERTLLEQLTKSMSKDMVGMDSGSGDDAGDGEGSGGLGLAHDLWLSMRSARS